MKLISAVLGAFHGYYDDHSSLPYEGLIAQSLQDKLPKGPQIAPELMRAILMRADMPAIMAARQCARFVDKLMDTHFWLEKFERDDGTVMALKLPDAVSGWIREYILVSQMFIEVNKLLEHNYIKMGMFNGYLNKEFKKSFELLLPNTVVENQYHEFGFIIASSDGGPIGYTEASIYFTIIGWDAIGDLEYMTDVSQFLGRLLYYYPSVRLTNGRNPIRMRY